MKIKQLLGAFLAVALTISNFNAVVFAEENNEYTADYTNEAVLSDSAVEIETEEIVNADFGYVTYAVTGGNLGFNTSTGMITYCGSSVTKAVIPSTIDGVSVTGIYSSAFSSCTSLTSVTIPSSVKSIGARAFYKCSSLTSITIPSGVTSIEASTFYNCTSLTSVSIPSAVTSIAAGAFNGCSSLKKVTIPGKVTSMGKAAFQDCSSLTTVTISSGVSEIGSWAFNNCTSLKSISVPGSVESIGDYAFKNCSSLTTVTLSSGVKNLGNYAFYYCSALTSVSLPNTLESIGESAFSHCTSLASVSIPSSVTAVGNSVFFCCTGLQTLTIYSKTMYFTGGSSSFCLSCSSLKTVYCYKGSAADNSSCYPKGVTISYLSSGSSVSAPYFTVKGVYGGRNVTFASETSGAKIYYSSASSTLTTSDTCVSNGETVLFENFYGTIYARAYYNGTWSNVARLILKIPVVNKPTITVSGTKATIKSSTPSAYIYYTTDGSTPSMSNGKSLGLNGGTVTVSDDVVIKAVAIRSCFTNSEVASYSMPNAFDGTVAPPSFTVVGTFGGRNVTFTSTTSKAKIYYSSTTSNLTTSDKYISNGKTVLFEDFYGTIYARAYYNGVWSNVARLILKIPTINTPTITYSSGKATIRTTTPNCYIYYTTDGSTPSITNGKKLCSNSYGQVAVSSGTTIKAIAVRSCFTNSSVTTYIVS